MYLLDHSCQKYFTHIRGRFISSTNADKIPKKTIVITILSAWEEEKKMSAISSIRRPSRVKIPHPLLIKISISHHLGVLDAG